MSYILKALRKAEQDRQAASPATAADFLGHAPVDPAGSGGRGKNLAILVLSALLVGCAVYLLANLGKGGEVVTAAPVVALVAKMEIPVVAKPDTAPPEIMEEPAVSKDDLAATQLTQVESQTEPELQPALAPPVPETPLSETVPAAPVQLPDINITGYIFFDDNPERSKLFVDGIVYRLGSRIGSGLVITGFAKDEVTVSFQGSEQRIQVR